jgi:hypothetical protein
MRTLVIKLFYFIFLQLLEKMGKNYNKTKARVERNVVAAEKEKQVRELAKAVAEAAKKQTAQGSKGKRTAKATAGAKKGVGTTAQAKPKAAAAAKAAQATQTPAQAKPRAEAAQAKAPSAKAGPSNEGTSPEQKVEQQVNI